MKRFAVRVRLMRRDFRPDDRGVATEYIASASPRRAVVCDLAPALSDDDFHGELRPLVDSFATQHELAALGDDWKEVTEKTATWILEQIFHVDLAYRIAATERKDAERLAARFIALVSDDKTNASHGGRCRYFTNGRCVDGPSMHTVDGVEMLGWMPATSATFDTGAVLVTRDRIGFVWALDED